MKKYYKLNIDNLNLKEFTLQECNFIVNNKDKEYELIKYDGNKEYSYTFNINNDELSFKQEELIFIEKLKNDNLYLVSIDQYMSNYELPSYTEIHNKLFKSYREASLYLIKEEFDVFGYYDDIFEKYVLEFTRKDIGIIEFENAYIKEMKVN